MTSIRRLITLAIAAATSILAASVAGPAAFATDVAPPAGGSTTPVSHHVVSAASSGGMLGWQIALLAIGSALVAALLTAGVDRVTINRRFAHRAV